MSRGNVTSGTSVSLEQLIALNDEIAALVRAGVPLDQGLQEIGRETPGRTGELAHRIGTRLSAGESLSQILASEERAFPPLWRAVVEAGLRSGRLASALEALSTTARQLSEMKRAIRLSLVYPFVIVAVAYALFVFLVTHLAPLLADAYQDLASTREPVMEALAKLGESSSWWVLWIPLIVFAGLMFWRYRSARATVLGQSVFSRITTLLWPPIGEAVREGRAATLAELLSLLLGQHVPLPEALILAADASGDRHWSDAARNAAQRLRSGGTVVTGSETNTEGLDSGLPPLLDWMIRTGSRDANMSPTLARAAHRYRQRATRAAESTLMYLPLVLTALIGGGVTLLQGVAVFGTLSRLLYALGAP